MHYSLLSLDDEHGSFRPSDLVDFESGDSDNEILAKYKPSKPQTKIYKQPYA